GHVEELETQRRGLESALSELEGLIKDTDKRIRESFEETFEAAAKNFEEVVQHLFPGGRGRLRLVHPEGPRPVIGGESASDQSASPGAEGESADSAAEETEHDDDRAAEGPGVEGGVAPSGKALQLLLLFARPGKSLVPLGVL